MVGWWERRLGWWYSSALKCLDVLDTTDDGNGCGGRVKKNGRTYIFLNNNARVTTSLRININVCHYFIKG